MNVDKSGPSWYDVSTHAEHLRERYNVAVEFRLVPPIRRFDGRGYTSWTAGVLVTTLGAKQQTAQGFTHSWGSGGSAKTCPSALLLGLLAADDWCREREAAAAKQAAF